MARSLPGQVLFHDSDDRECFLRFLGNYLQQADFRCYAWVLMDNHYHLVVRTSELELWRVLKPLNTSYAQYHGKKHGRVGPLFRDRYRSILTQDQNYVQELVRYVHLNPVRGGVCRDLRALDRYSWCGHGVLMGHSRRPFQDTTAVLRRFGSSTTEARMHYRQYLAEGLKTAGDDEPLLRLVRQSNAGVERGRGAAHWVIGDSAFVKKILSQSQALRLRVSRFEREGGSLDAIARAVCDKYRVEPEHIKTRHRGGPCADARKAFALAAVREFGARTGLVAQYLGVTLAAVSAMVRGAEAIGKGTP